MAEIQGKPDGEKNIRQAFSVFDKYSNQGDLNIAEMKHVLSRVGDPLAEQDLENFFAMLDNGSGYVNMEDVLSTLGPQTSKDLYSKSVPRGVPNQRRELFRDEPNYHGDHEEL